MSCLQVQREERKMELKVFFKPLPKPRLQPQRLAVDLVLSRKDSLGDRHPPGPEDVGGQAGQAPLQGKPSRTARGRSRTMHSS